MGICPITKQPRESSFNESINNETINEKDRSGIDYDKWEISQLNKNKIERIDILCDSGKNIINAEKKFTVEDFIFLNVYYIFKKSSLICIFRY